MTKAELAQVRYRLRNTHNPATREALWARLRAESEVHQHERLGEVVRPADYRRHQHDFHQWVVGYVQCSGCDLRLKDTSAQWTALVGQAAA